MMKQLFSLALFGPIVLGAIVVPEAKNGEPGPMHNSRIILIKIYQCIGFEKRDTQINVNIEYEKPKSVTQDIAPECGEVTCDLECVKQGCAGGRCKFENVCQCNDCGGPEPDTLLTIQDTRGGRVAHDVDCTDDGCYESCKQEGACGGYCNVDACSCVYCDNQKAPHELRAM